MQDDFNTIIREKDVLGQEINPLIIEDPVSETARQISPPVKDYSTQYKLPELKTRIVSTFIDMFVIVVASFISYKIIELIEDVPAIIRAVLFLSIFILYEPILVAYSCTVGQYFTHIRVRRFSNPEKRILLISTFVRTTTKALFGWLSFVTISFNVNKRAIHDYFSGSMVVLISADKKNQET